MRYKNDLFKILSIALFCCGAISFVHAEDKGNGFHNPHFSPDGKLLAFDLCRNNNCDNVIHEMEANTFTKFVDRKGKKIANLSFSPDGKNVLFVAITEAHWPWNKSNQQLATGQLSGTKFNLIPTGDGIKMYPTFSGENTVLYWGANEIPAKQGGGTFKETQLVELDIKTRKSMSVMPREFRFHNPSPPHSLGDHDLIVTSLLGFRQPGTPYEEWLKSDKRDEVLIISKIKKTVTPLNTGIDASFFPSVVRQTGQILFVGRLEKNEGQNGFVHDVFLYGANGPTRLTTLRTYIRGMDVTTDGKALAIILATPDRKILNGRLVIYDIRTKQHQEIVPKNIVETTVDINN